MAVPASEALKLPAALEVIRGNINKHGNPLGLKGQEVSGWAKGLDLPRRGDVLFYTAGEYQMLPYIDSLVGALERMQEGSIGFSLMMGVRNLFDRAGISAEKLYASVLAKDRDRFNAIVRKAAEVLQKMGLEICWLGEQELYSGALLYEFGYGDDLRQHARKVIDGFRSTGAKTIITLSPHTAEVLTQVYPKLDDTFDFKVKTFVEAVWEVMQQSDQRWPAARISGLVTIHDACRMARELGITEEIRGILGRLDGISIVEAEQNRRWTSCCGGPGKMVFPEISKKVAARRVAELAATGAATAVSFCPYCLAQLDAGRGDTKLEVVDFIELLAGGMLG
ncbi:MAG: (Fe-S)-binding protein [Clostridia bacterium]|nr:MAG: (Fe-S)-binding protein [Clostridia bacterium]